MLDKSINMVILTPKEFNNLIKIKEIAEKKMALIKLEILNNYVIEYDLYCDDKELYEKINNLIGYEKIENSLEIKYNEKDKYRERIFQQKLQELAEYKKEYKEELRKKYKKFRKIMFFKTLRKIYSKSC